jgi:hypothetical protein
MSVEIVNDPKTVLHNVTLTTFQHKRARFRLAYGPFGFTSMRTYKSPSSGTEGSGPNQAMSESLAG